MIGKWFRKLIPWYFRKNDTILMLVSLRRMVYDYEGEWLRLMEFLVHQESLLEFLQRFAKHRGIHGIRVIEALKTEVYMSSDPGTLLAGAFVWNDTWWERYNLLYNTQGDDDSMPMTRHYISKHIDNLLENL